MQTVFRRRGTLAAVGRGLYNNAGRREPRHVWRPAWARAARPAVGDYPMASEMRRGLAIILTGDGKGKTTAALGLALRALGHGLRVTVVQFLKMRECGEHRSAERLAPDLRIRRMGLGFVPPPGSCAASCGGAPGAREEHRGAASAAMEEVRRLLRGGACDMVVADEVLTAVALGLVEEQAVEALLQTRPSEVHLVLTGRGATESLIRRADLVTEMRAVKHPYDSGAAAQPGIEF